MSVMKTLTVEYRKTIIDILIARPEVTEVTMYFDIQRQYANIKMVPDNEAVGNNDLRKQMLLSSIKNSSRIP